MGKRDSPAAEKDASLPKDAFDARCPRPDALVVNTKEIQEQAEGIACSCCTKPNIQSLSDACLVLGFLSIILSIVTWFTASRGSDKNQGERLGIFIGLWVPSFFILSNRLSRLADTFEEEEDAK